jgi:predicted DNA-binding transcriptional regulator AlpA
MSTSTTNKTYLPLPENDDVLIRRTEVPQYIPVQAQTLARWATEGCGPSYVKLGKRLVAYRSGDLRQWLRENVRTNTISA